MPVKDLLTYLKDAAIAAYQAHPKRTAVIIWVSIMAFCVIGGGIVSYFSVAYVAKASKEPPPLPPPAPTTPIEVKGSAPAEAGPCGTANSGAISGSTIANDCTQKPEETPSKKAHSK